MGSTRLPCISNLIEHANEKSHTTLTSVISSFFWEPDLASRIGVSTIHGILLAGLRQTAAGPYYRYLLIKGIKLPERLADPGCVVLGGGDQGVGSNGGGPGGPGMTCPVVQALA